MKRDRHTVDVKYAFTDPDGKSAIGYMTVPQESWVMPESHTLKVTYVRGNPDNSIATADRSNFWFIIFTIITLGAVALAVKWWRDVEHDLKAHRSYR
jgi:H+/Cl- antiporter ClcA